jgi:hypothetical protein
MREFMSTEIENEKKKFFLDKYFQLILERDRMVIFFVQLMIALLVMAGFSDKIISNTGFIKILISIFLFLTTIMLIDYLLKLNDGLNAHAKIFTTENLPTKKWFKKIIDGSVYVYTSIIIILIDIIIGFIFSNLLISLCLFWPQIIIICIYFHIKTKTEATDL